MGDMMAPLESAFETIGAPFSCPPVPGAQASKRKQEACFLSQETSRKKRTPEPETCEGPPCTCSHSAAGQVSKCLGYPAHDGEALILKNGLVVLELDPTCPVAQGEVSSFGPILSKKSLQLIRKQTENSEVNLKLLLSLRKSRLFTRVKRSQSKVLSLVSRARRFLPMKALKFKHSVAGVVSLLRTTARKNLPKWSAFNFSPRRHYQRRRIYMHRADMAVDGLLSPAWDRASKTLRRARARFGIGPPVPTRWGEEGCRGLNDFHRAPVKGFRLPAEVAAYRSGGDSILAMNMPRMLYASSHFRFVPGTLPTVAEEEW